ncbi:UDP-N-acetylglucosamine transferase subunit ALG14 homolog [Lucilia sericata]|uniref:UDP-N-acetylglucosamine transferase subunit ALG14 homolog n=1 Tax=Lucilia sericata TaxID=13632 RepID=UPI0018A80957|nr:UDP-N-acetylglucosamine transferase subunit ALG14 homolog [Lucilia sericata]
METKPVWCILGSGGHTAEMCIILQGLLQKTKDLNNYKPMKFLVANTDKTSKDKIQLTMDELKQNVSEDDFIYIPRAREVGQSWFTTVFTFLYALVWSFWLVFKEKPRLILCNGPGTCVPFCIAGFLSKLARRSKTKLVYVESFCRVHEISMSGRILLPYLDVMIVQWEPLTRIEYLGRKKIKYFGNIL